MAQPGRGRTPLGCEPRERGQRPNSSGPAETGSTGWGGSEYPPPLPVPGRVYRRRPEPGNTGNLGLPIPALPGPWYTGLSQPAVFQAAPALPAPQPLSAPKPRSPRAVSHGMAAGCGVPLPPHTWLLPQLRPSWPWHGAHPCRPSSRCIRLRVGSLLLWLPCLFPGLCEPHWTRRRVPTNPGAAAGGSGTSLQPPQLPQAVPAQLPAPSPLRLPPLPPTPFPRPLHQHRAGTRAPRLQAPTPGRWAPAWGGLA